MRASSNDFYRRVKGDFDRKKICKEFLSPLVCEIVSGERTDPRSCRRGNRPPKFFLAREESSPLVSPSLHTESFNSGITTYLELGQTTD